MECDLCLGGFQLKRSIPSPALGAVKTDAGRMSVREGRIHDVRMGDTE